MDDSIDDQWVEHFLEESDRGCVLIAHAILEELLGELLLCHFKRCSNSSAVAKEMLRPGMNSALGSFAPRSKLACVLGLIDDSVFNLLRHLNTLQVDFAHYKTPSLLLSDKQVKPLTDAFTDQQKKCVECMREAWEPVLEDKHYSPARIAFVLTAIVLINEFKSPLCKGEESLCIGAHAIGDHSILHGE